MFRGSYVPSFFGKARNIGPSEYRPFYPLVRSYVPRVLYSAVLQKFEEFRTLLSKVFSTPLKPPSFLILHIAVKLMGGATNL